MNKSLLNKVRVIILVISSIFFCLANINAQINVHGKITSTVDDQPLPGATVQIQGTSKGVITDVNGDYEITVDNSDAILKFSYVGYLSEEIKVADQQEINMSLTPDILGLQEVVVTAYSEKAKTEISSSVVSLKSDDINKVTTNGIADMLIGKVAGVQAENASGQPGETADIRIRGVGSVFSPQKPLIVVDGVVGGTYNPNDIESVTVLKDAGATGLYGSEAASGVILITTKKGIKGSSEIRAKITTGYKKPEFGNFSMMNTEELYNYHKMLYSPALFPTARPDSLLNHDFDWVNNSYGKSNLTSVNVSASGANEKTNYYLSVDYMDDQGTLIGTDYHRYSVRSNVSHQLNKWLNITTNITFNHSTSDYAHWNLSEGVFRLQPWDSPYYPNGELVYNVNAAGWLSNVTANPYQSMKYNKLDNSDMDGLGNFRFGIKITDWLKIDSWTTASAATGKYEEIYSPLTYEGATNGGEIYNSIYIDKSLDHTSLLKFDRTFGNHGLDGFVGFEASKYVHEYDYGGTAYGILNGQQILGVAGQQEKPVGDKVEETGMSVLSQLNYNYLKKYFVTVSFRRDGDSKFSPRHKYATFFTYAASWLMSSEQFMQQIKFIHYLKLRASYGAVGNSTFPSDSYYPYFPSFVAAGVYNSQSAYFPDKPGNYDLTWETSYPLNLGIDFGVFNRVELNIDYYNTHTKNLLFQDPLPTSQGYTYQWKNVGEIQNKGLELNVKATVIRTKDLTWDLNLNIASNKNKLLALSDKQGVNSIPIQRTGDATQILTVGGGAFDWYMPKWLGVDPNNGDPLWENIIYDANGNIIGREATNDYSLAAQDYQDMGSPFPKFSGGFGTRISYKGFSLNATFAYSYGNKIYHSGRQEIDNDGENISVNAMKLLPGWSRWQNPGDNATHPRPIFGGNMNSNKYSSRYLEDGSYLRLRNLTLAYDLPQEFAKKAKLKGLRVSLSMDNLKTWTKYSGMDPDIQLYLNGENLPGTQYFKYPISKQYLLGLEISL